MATTSFFMLFDRDGKPILPGSGAFRRPDWIELINYRAGDNGQGYRVARATTFRLAFNQGAYSPILTRRCAEGRSAATGMLFTTTEDGKAYQRCVLFDPLPVSLQGSGGPDDGAVTELLELETRHFSMTYRSADGAVTQTTVRASD